jgi:tripartite-type tricarboxylate transporter receptor subunit TctC
MAPAGTPEAIINKLNDTISEALKSPEVVARFDKIGADIVNEGPAAFGEHLKSDQAMWTALVMQAGLASQ